MDRLEFLKNVRLQFDYTDTNLIQFDTQFDTLDEWCSLLGLGVLAMIQDTYGIKIPLREIIPVTTVEELYNLVLLKKNEQIASGKMSLDY